MEPEPSAIKLLQHQSGQHTPLCLRVDWKPRFTKASIAGQALLGEIFRHPADRGGWHTHHARVSTNPPFPPELLCSLTHTLLWPGTAAGSRTLSIALPGSCSLSNCPSLLPSCPSQALQISVSSESASTWGFCLLKLSFPLLPPVSYLAWSFALEPISLISLFF